jgi:hypothetical protein
LLGGSALSCKNRVATGRLYRSTNKLTKAKVKLLGRCIRKVETAVSSMRLLGEWLEESFRIRKTARYLMKLMIAWKMISRPEDRALEEAGEGCRDLWVSAVPNGFEDGSGFTSGVGNLEPGLPIRDLALVLRGDIKALSDTPDSSLSGRERPCSAI